jgi:hypothetical protein
MPIQGWLVTPVHLSATTDKKSAPISGRAAEAEELSVFQVVVFLARDLIESSCNAKTMVIMAKRVALKNPRWHRGTNVKG